MQRESGGNPTIVNRWDSNWLRGTPSVGLMQVIGPTYARYPARSATRARSSTGEHERTRQLRPYAGLNYALHNYGSLGALSKPGGYAAGTPYASPGWHRVGELGPEWVRFRGGEQVMPYRQGAGGATTIVNVTMNLDPSAHAFQREVQDAIRGLAARGVMSRTVLTGR
jgi:SLT domain-containing protein